MANETLVRQILVEIDHNPSISQRQLSANLGVSIGIGPDNGDLPNLYAATDGTAKAEFFTTRVSVSGGAMPALLDEDGSAVIIHDMPDDYLTQPIGGAGGRIRM